MVWSVPRANERGQATVEVAAMSPVVALVVMLVIQIGLVWRDQILVVQAAREAARAAAVAPDLDGVRRAARESIGVSADRLSVRVVRRDEPGGVVTVEVQMSPLTTLPMLGRLLAGRSVRAEATMMVEARAGQQAQCGDAAVAIKWCVAVATLW